ncbi:hypothetical protein AF332_16040 [Sporosarcina globispora]|uniref:Lipoprotein n=1 Tax=Sporosarcina globispora TaxID=1459 RepID=A0A0M0GF96_SPOGL|nr:hypothetical protein [Sporosarcina globispora]KON88167.1 hypothetical protein AF332_16040 [Sporosarcina globispora]
MRCLLLRKMLVICVILMFGCSNKAVEEAEFPPKMTAAVEVNGADYQMEKGNYQWVRIKGSETETVATDHGSPNQMADHLKPIPLKPDQKIKVKIEDDPIIKVFLWNETGKEREIKLGDNQITVPASKGKYIYEVLAEWTNGKVSYTFVTDVQ